MNQNSKNVINCIQRRKKDLRSVFHSKCCLCGYDLVPEALEFHHVNPAEKEFGIAASNATTKALSAQLKEMKKCILVCANCHRGIHNNYFQIPENWESFYDEEIAQELLNKLTAAKTHKLYYCLKCGAEIASHKATLCVNCYQKTSRVCERPSREELKNLIRTLPFTQIGQRFNVSDNAIRKWCDSYSLPRKKAEINNYSDEEWEKI